MKKLTLSTLCMALMMIALASGIMAADKPVLGVAEFRNQARGVFWWYSNVGWDLAGMLANELAATGSFSVVERSSLEHVLDEQDLADYGRVAAGTGAEIGKLTGAQYLVMGTVTSFEGKTKGSGGGIGYKGLRIGGKKDKAYIAVDVRVVNTTTGALDFVRTVEARSSGYGVDVGVHRSGFSGNLSQYENTPAGKAIRACIIEITDYLDCVMIQQDSCMAEYQAKEDRRREKTKGSVKIE